MVVVGNKSDLYTENELIEIQKEGETFANSINAIFSVCSAKNGTGIDTLFYNLGKEILEKKIIPQKQGMQLQSKTKDNKKCCN